MLQDAMKILYVFVLFFVSKFKKKKAYKQYSLHKISDNIFFEGVRPLHKTPSLTANVLKTILTLSKVKEQIRMHKVL